MKISVVGCGAFGTANAIMLAPKHEVTLIFPSDLKRDKDMLYNLRNGTQKSNYLYFPGTDLPPGLKLSDNFDSIETADVVLLAQPTKFLWESFYRVARYLSVNHKMVMALLSKGFDPNSYDPMGVILEDYLRSQMSFYRFAVISGPTFAHELLATMKAHVASVASYNLHAIKKLKEMVKGANLRLEGTTDLVGVSWGGCLKNAYAIGYGICDGLGYTEEMLDKYIWKAHAESKFFLDFANARPKTNWSPAVWGDLRVTCRGQSRNRAFGKFVSGYQSKESIAEYVRARTVEGYESMVKLWEVAHKNKLDAPLLYGIHNLCCYGTEPKLFPSMTS